MISEHQIDIFQAMLILKRYCLTQINRIKRICLSKCSLEAKSKVKIIEFLMLFFD